MDLLSLPAFGTISFPSISTQDLEATTTHQASAQSSAIALVPIRTEEGSKDEKQATDESSVDWKAGRQELFILITLSIISLMVSLDATVIVPSLPAITLGLNGSANDAFWTGTAYLLPCAIFQPFIAGLSDIFGRRDMNLLALALFTIGTIVCCVAQNFTVMLVGRSIQGVGGGGILTLGLVIVTDIVPLRQRPTYYGIIQAAWAIGTICGPLIGGALVEHTIWRWIFYINFPLCAIGFVLLPLTIKLHRHTSSLGHKLLQMDWIGGVIFVASTTSFLMAVSWGGTQFPWNSYQTLVPMIFGAAGVVLTLAWEAFVAKRPFLRVRIFRGISAKAAYLGTLCQGMLLMAELYCVPFYFGSVQNEGPFQTGVGELPITCGLVPTSLIIGIIITRIGGLRWAVWGGWVFTILGHGLMIVLDVGTSTATWASIFVLVGIGHGFLLNALNFSAQSAADPADAAAAGSMYLFMRTFGMCIGVVIGGTVFQNILATHLMSGGLPADIAGNAEIYLGVLKQMPEDSAFRIAVVQAYAQGFKGVFMVLTGIAALGGVASLFIKSHDLNAKLRTEHGLRKPSQEDLA